MRERKALCVLHPSYEQLNYKEGYDKSQRELISFFEINKITHINLLPYFRKEGKEAWLMPLDNHPSPKGHLVIANEIVKIIPIL